MENTNLDSLLASLSKDLNNPAKILSNPEVLDKSKQHVDSLLELIGRIASARKAKVPLAHSSKEAEIVKALESNLPGYRSVVKALAAKLLQLESTLVPEDHIKDDHTVAEFEASEEPAAEEAPVATRASKRINAPDPRKTLLEDIMKKAKEDQKLMEQLLPKLESKILKIPFPEELDMDDVATKFTTLADITSDNDNVARLFQCVESIGIVAQRSLARLGQLEEKLDYNPAKKFYLTARDTDWNQALAAVMWTAIRWIEPRYCLTAHRKVEEAIAEALSLDAPPRYQRHQALHAALASIPKFRAAGSPPKAVDTPQRLGNRWAASENNAMEREDEGSAMSSRTPRHRAEGYPAVADVRTHMHMYEILHHLHDSSLTVMPRRLSTLRRFLRR